MMFIIVKDMHIRLTILLLVCIALTPIDCRNLPHHTDTDTVAGNILSGSHLIALLLTLLAIMI